MGANRATLAEEGEAQNLTIGMGMRRLTRLTSGFSKKAGNLAAAMSLHFCYYNFARPHQTLTKRAGATPATPAMATGLSDHAWSLTELVDLLESN